MKLNKEQIEQIEKVCSEIDYGSVTIKINATNKFIDLVVEKQIRMKNEYTVNTAKQIDKRY